MSCRFRGSPVWVGLRAIMVPAALVGGASTASAQELVHTFINPSFGGNPFYSDHLRGIAEIHRPDEPEEPDSPTPTPEELLVSQLQAQLRATLSSNILRAIQTAQVGQSGEFLVGNSRINYTRTTLGTRVTFTNLETGDVREIFVPSGSTGVASASASSAEAALGAPGTSVSLSPSASQSEAPGLLNLPPL
jgi:curli production assembly/transport component CsgF